MIKNQKGISLVSLAITVIVILAISETVLYNLKTNLSLQRLKDMQADIENLNGKVTNYYLQYGTLPIYRKFNTSIPVDDNYIEDLEYSATNGDINIEGEYYIVDLSAMENITLNYGEDYKKIKDEEFDYIGIESLDGGRLTDIYIINAVSHNIFYVRGITYEGKTYYTQYQDEYRNNVGINEQVLDEITDEIENAINEKNNHS